MKKMYKLINIHKIPSSKIMEFIMQDSLFAVGVNINNSAKRKYEINGDIFYSYTFDFGKEGCFTIPFIISNWKVLYKMLNKCNTIELNSIFNHCDRALNWEQNEFKLFKDKNGNYLPTNYIFEQIVSVSQFILRERKDNEDNRKFSKSITQNKILGIASISLAGVVAIATIIEIILKIKHII